MAARPKNGKQKLSYISVESPAIQSLSTSPLRSFVVDDSPKTSPSPSPTKPRRRSSNFASAAARPKSWLAIVSLLAVVGFLRVAIEFSRPILIPCSTTAASEAVAHIPDKLAAAGLGGGSVEDEEEEEEEEGFWKQPDGMGYRPCLKFSEGYRRETRPAAAERKQRYLMVVVSGGLNQQRNQIVDAVVIARILSAALVVPILQVNVIWADDSEFSDIFDVGHFKRALAEDVKVVSSLPSTHLMSRPAAEKRTPLHASPRWIRSRYLRRINKDGVLLLRGLDSRLSKDLPPDLQKLRCKVAFHALKFAAPIRELGDKLVSRMRRNHGGGPYIALHLRLEEDVWVRTGCLPGLGPGYDAAVREARERRPTLLTSRSNMTHGERRAAGLCPLNAMEVARLLEALGAPRDAGVFWAGGEPLGGTEALLPLSGRFPNLFNKKALALPGELEPFANRSSLLAAVDYVVCEQSDVFVPSHGGNMGHIIQGNRAYMGHKKFVTPNKRQMIAHLMNASISDSELNGVIKELHKDSLGGPELRRSKPGRDVTAYPVSECMCRDEDGVV